jgi:hypothetical protein
MHVDMESVLYTVQYQDDETEECNEQEIEELIVSKNDTNIPPELSSFIVAAPPGTKERIEPLNGDTTIEKTVAEVTSTKTEEASSIKADVSLDSATAVTTVVEGETGVAEQDTTTETLTGEVAVTEVDVVEDDSGEGQGAVILDTIDPRTKLEQLKEIVKTLPTTASDFKPKRKYTKRSHEQKYKNGTKIHKVSDGVFSFFHLCFAYMWIANHYFTIFGHCLFALLTNLNGKKSNSQTVNGILEKLFLLIPMQSIIESDMKMMMKRNMLKRNWYVF